MSNLFDPGPVDPGKLEGDALKKLSDDQRRTLRNNGLLAGGTHPVTYRPLANNGHTCGDCDHHTVNQRNTKRFHKCELRLTRGPATDIRCAWPACDQWKEATDD